MIRHKAEAATGLWNQTLPYLLVSLFSKQALFHTQRWTWKTLSKGLMWPVYITYSFRRQSFYLETESTLKRSIKRNCATMYIPGHVNLLFEVPRDVILPLLQSHYSPGFVCATFLQKKDMRSSPTSYLLTVLLSLDSPRNICPSYSACKFQKKKKSSSLIRIWVFLLC